MCIFQVEEDEKTRSREPLGIFSSEQRNHWAVEHRLDGLSHGQLAISLVISDERRS